MLCSTQAIQPVPITWCLLQGVPCFYTVNKVQGCLWQLFSVFYNPFGRREECGGPDVDDLLTFFEQHF